MHNTFIKGKNMTDKATKSIILVRVSTREQEEGYSIEAQKYRLVEKP